MNINLIRCLCIALLASVVLFAPDVRAQQIVASMQCEGSYLGVRLQGQLVVERWVSARSYRYHGRFLDPSGNVIELEVFSASNTGTGGAWTNGMRHRETYLNLTVFQNGFLVQTEDGVVTEFSCQ